MKIIKWRRGKQKRLSKRLNVRLMRNYIASWGQRIEKNIYKLAKTSEMKTRDLNGAKCIKYEDQRVLVKEWEIKERWKSYFDKIFNESNRLE